MLKAEVDNPLVQELVQRLSVDSVNSVTMLQEQVNHLHNNKGKELVNREYSKG